MLCGKVSSTPERVTAVDYQAELPLSPVEGPGRQFIEFLPSVVNPPAWVRTPKDPTWVEKDLVTRTYIDDGITIEKLNMKAQPLLQKDGKQFKNPLAEKTQARLNTVKRRAAERGMKVNEKKTEIACVSSALGYTAKAHMEISNEGGTITSTQSLKILGFTIDSDAGITTQVNILRQKFRRRIWLLRVAKRGGCVKRTCQRHTKRT
jgi:hypothetical protein